MSQAGTIPCTNLALAALESDAIVVPWLEGDARDAVPGLDAATGGEIGRALVSREFLGRPYDLFATPITEQGWRARRLVLVGAGTRAGFDAAMHRRLATCGGLHVRQKRAARAAFLLREPMGADAAQCVQAVAEGLTLAEFAPGVHKTEDEERRTSPEWTVVCPELAGDGLERARSAAARGRVLGESCNLARGLANEPGNILTPREFALRMTRIVGEVGVAVEVLDEERIAQLGMGLLLGVARGSAEPPRLVVMRYEPAGAPQAPVLGLVGKGITFDTGGISIKEPEGMERMKDDMSGGAAVACAMRAIAVLGAPIRVIGVVPATENMPGGRATKPGDVLRSASGKTVEVVNTDAEGRLILGDALWYARQCGATHLVDIATLTGACVVALGRITSGLFGTPDCWVEHVRDCAARAGDRAWRMPLFDEYREQLKSEIADMMNTGGRPGGSITAALFLKEFTGGRPWAHLDIAGTAWEHEGRPYLPKGPSGVGVRTLAELAFTSRTWA